MTHRDCGATELCPAIKVQQPIDTANFAAHKPLPFGQGHRVSAVEVIDGCHCGKVCKRKPGMQLPENGTEQHEKALGLGH